MASARKETSVEKIIIERFENDPNGDLGSMAAESGRWEVIVD